MAGWDISKFTYDLHITQALSSDRWEPRALTTCITHLALCKRVGTWLDSITHVAEDSLLCLVNLLIFQDVIPR